MSQIPEAVANKLYEKVLDYFEDVKGERMFRSSPTFRPALEKKMAELANLLCEADGDPHVKVLVTHTEATDGVAEEVAKAYRKGKIKDVWGGTTTRRRATSTSCATGFPSLGWMTS